MSTRTKEATVDLGEASLELRFDFNAIARIEELTGKNVLNGQLDEGMTGSDARAVVFACAAAFDESRGKAVRRTITEIGSLMGIDNVRKLTGAIRELIVAAFPKTEPTEEGAGEEVPTLAPAE